MSVERERKRGREAGLPGEGDGRREEARTETDRVGRCSTREQVRKSREIVPLSSPEISLTRQTASPLRRYISFYLLFSSSANRQNYRGLV